MKDPIRTRQQERRPAEPQVSHQYGSDPQVKQQNYPEQPGTTRTGSTEREREREPAQEDNRRHFIPLDRDEIY